MSIETTYTHARENLASHWDAAVEGHEVIIFRRRGSEPVAMAASKALSENTLDHPLDFSSEGFAGLCGKTVRLKLSAENARVYSSWVGEWLTSAGLLPARVFPGLGGSKKRLGGRPKNSPSMTICFFDKSRSPRRIG